MLEKGKPSPHGSPGVSWGRSGGKEGSMKRLGVEALGAWWVGEKSGQTASRALMGDKGTGWIARVPCRTCWGSGPSQGLRRLGRKAEPTEHSWHGCVGSPTCAPRKRNCAQPRSLACSSGLASHSKLLRPGPTVLSGLSLHTCWSLFHSHFLWD